MVWPPISWKTLLSGQNEDQERWSHLLTVAGCCLAGERVRRGSVGGGGHWKELERKLGGNSEDGGGGLSGRDGN